MSQKQTMPNRAIYLAIATAAFATPPVLATPDDLFEWATITHAGNTGYDRDTVNPYLTGRGSVAYEYRIARDEVSSGQFITFLNTFTTQSDELAARIRPPLTWGGEIDHSYSGPGVRYKLRTDVAHADRLPILATDWRSAAYFVNWMNNDLSSDPSAIEDGAYDASTFGGSPPTGGFTDQSTRHADARYWIPSMDEWLKAAHYDPNKEGQDQGGWWIYNNGSDTPLVGGPPGVGDTSAGWVIDDDGRPAWETPLGSYPQTMSPWGLRDVSGGGGEWTETWIPYNDNLTDRIWMGAPAGSLSWADDATYFGSDYPTSRGFNLSFRVASTVPSPASIVALCGVILHQSTRKRSRCESS